MKSGWTGTNACWAFSIGALCLGLVIFLTATSFPKASQSSSEHTWKLGNMTNLVFKGRKTLITLTQEIWGKRSFFVFVFLLFF
jgi:hypothetical protein